MRPAANTPPVIHQLEEAVINRIAAGEVIQKPSSAAKELLENSLDAGSTQISIVVKNGGLKLLQITDNGHGIRTADLPILCSRHTTSKLTTYEDLETIQSLGFRGEALCSISFVSHMTVTTMTSGSDSGFRAVYKDGCLCDSEPKMCAANLGTTISVEDLFFNCPTRKKSFKNGSEEYARILDIVGRYAVLCSNVGFTVKKQGESRVDLQVFAGASQLARISSLYGAALSKELVPISLSEGSIESNDVDSGVSFKMKGYISGVNYTGKKTILVLFINSRCVECSQLKRAIEAVYATVLPKSNKPYVYLEMEIPTHHVDVNIHPTKKEVEFAHQLEIINSVTVAVQKELTRSNNSRSFTQMTLPEPFVPAATEDSPSDKAQSSSTLQRDKAVGDNKIVRTDPLARSLDAFVDHRRYRESALGSGEVLRSAPRRVIRAHSFQEKRAQSVELDDSTKKLKPSVGDVETVDGMVEYLLNEVDARQHSGLAQILQGHTFVGMATETQGFVQYKTGLFLLDISILSNELFYQLLLRQFGDLEMVKLEPPADIKSLAMIALGVLESTGEWDESKGRKDLIAEAVVSILKKHKTKLANWFSIHVGEDGDLLGIPNIIPEYTPEPKGLPEFLLRLSRDVDWCTDVKAVENVAKLTSAFYAIKETSQVTRQTDEGSKTICPNEWTIEHIILQSMRKCLKPSEEQATDGAVIQVTTLETLFKVFERC